MPCGCSPPTIAKVPVGRQIFERLDRRQMALVGIEEAAHREIFAPRIEPKLAHQLLAVGRGLDRRNLALIEIGDREIGDAADVVEALQQRLIGTAEGEDGDVLRARDILPEILDHGAIGLGEHPVDRRAVAPGPHQRHERFVGGDVAIEAVHRDDRFLGGGEEVLHAAIGCGRYGAVEARLELQENGVVLGQLARDALDLRIALAPHRGGKADPEQADRQTLHIDCEARGLENGASSASCRKPRRIPRHSWK